MYPLKFKSIVKDKIWCGDKLEKLYGKNPDGLPNIGESWELSCLDGKETVAVSGPFEGMTLRQVIGLLKERLVGRHVY